MNQSTWKVIGFESFVNKNSRAVETSTLSNFFVFGHYLNDDDDVEYIFPNVEVIKGDNNKWSYTHTPQYWTDNDYWFAAYAQDNTATQIGTAKFENVSSNGKLTIPFDITYTTTESAVTTCSDLDLVADIKAVNGEDRPTVEFTLKHLLSKITFQIINASPERLNMTVEDLTISGILPDGTFVSSAVAVDQEWKPLFSDWSAAGTAEDIIPLRGSDAIIAVGGKTSVSNELYVIPQVLTNIKYSVTATFYQNGDPVDTYTFEGDVSTTNISQWNPSTIYNYQISLPSAPNKIEFSATVEDDGWTIANGEANIELRNYRENKTN